MVETVDLEVHLTTDTVTGDLNIEFDPVEHGGLGAIDVAEWPDIRSDLREHIREQIEDPEAWVAHLDSNRAGERLDVQIGRITVTTEGEIHSESIHRTSVGDVNW